jgi:hypothetical protein
VVLGYFCGISLAVASSPPQYLPLSSKKHELEYYIGEFYAHCFC